MILREIAVYWNVGVIELMCAGVWLRMNENKVTDDGKVNLCVKRKIVSERLQIERIRSLSSDCQEENRQLFG